MSNQVIALADALSVALTTYTSQTFTRAYVIENSQEEVQEAKWYVLPGGEEMVSRGNANQYNIEVALVYQRGLPKHSATKKPIRNLTFLDECVEAVEAMANLFRNPDDVSNPDEHTGMFTTCGSYGSHAGFNFASFSNNPMFDPIILRDNHIFSSVIRLTYRG